MRVSFSISFFPPLYVLIITYSTKKVNTFLTTK
nr:MAG TPA: hypothetical protein [Bacteriophage sp.]